MTIEDSRDARAALAIEEADAWFEYLEATRHAARNRYDEIETWAWARLEQRLVRVERSRSDLRGIAA